MTKRAAAYIRVSTQKQSADDRHGLPRQKSLIETYARSIGAEITETFQDAISGRTAERANLERLLTTPKSAFDLIIISETRALGRRLSTSYVVLDELLDTGLPVHSATHRAVIDLDDDASVVQVSTGVMMDHIERNRISYRMQNARVAMAERGLNPSGTRAYGLTSSRGRVIVRPDEAAVARRIFDLSAQKLSLNEIARRLNAEGVPAKDGGLWHSPSLARMIRSPLYKGRMTWGGHEIELPALVDEALWEAAQRPRRGAPAKLGFLLTGHLRCGHCGVRMQAHVARNVRGVPIARYRCAGGSRPRRTGCGAVLGRQKLERRVAAGLADLFADDDMLKGLLDTGASQSGPLEAGLAAVAAEDAEAFAARRRGVISYDELAVIRGDLERRRTALYAEFGPRTYPLAEFRAKAATLEPRKTLELFGIVAVATKTELSFVIE